MTITYRGDNSATYYPNRKPIRVFISYSHDSNEHSSRILQLSNALRKDGIDSRIDQYLQSPSEGWPLWMERQLELADYILVVISRGYINKIKDRSNTNLGKGVKWETILNYQYLYDNSNQNNKIIPVLFQQKDYDIIPTPLRPYNYYCLENRDKYVELYRRLTDQPIIKMPPLGKLISLPAKNEECNFSFLTDRVNSSNDSMVAGDNDLYLSVELKLNIEFSKFDSAKKQTLLNAISSILDLDESEIEIERIRKGSTYIVLRIPFSQAIRLLAEVRSGKLYKRGVMGVKIVQSSFATSPYPNENGPVLFKTLNLRNQKISDSMWSLSVRYLLFNQSESVIAINELHLPTYYISAGAANDKKQLSLNLSQSPIAASKNITEILPEDGIESNCILNIDTDYQIETFCSIFGIMVDIDSTTENNVIKYRVISDSIYIFQNNPKIFTCLDFSKIQLIQKPELKELYPSELDRIEYGFKKHFSS